MKRIFVNKISLYNCTQADQLPLIYWRDQNEFPLTANAICLHVDASADTVIGEEVITKSAYVDTADEGASLAPFSISIPVLR